MTRSPTPPDEFFPFDEARITRLFHDGLTTKEIAAELLTDERTIKPLVEKVKRKWVFRIGDERGSGAGWERRTGWDVSGDWIASFLIWGGAALVIFVVLGIIWTANAPREPVHLQFP